MSVGQATKLFMMHTGNRAAMQTLSDLMAEPVVMAASQLQMGRADGILLAMSGNSLRLPAQKYQTTFIGLSYGVWHVYMYKVWPAN